MARKKYFLVKQNINTDDYVYIISSTNWNIKKRINFTGKVLLVDREDGRGWIGQEYPFAHKSKEFEIVKKSFILKEIKQAYYLEVL